MIGVVKVRTDTERIVGLVEVKIDPEEFLVASALERTWGALEQVVLPGPNIGRGAVEPERKGDPDQDIRILRLEHRRAQAAAISADIQSRKTALLVKRLIHAVEVWDDPITYIC